MPLRVLPVGLNPSLRSLCGYCQFYRKYKEQGNILNCTMSVNKQIQAVRKSTGQMAQVLQQINCKKKIGVERWLRLKEI